MIKQAEKTYAPLEVERQVQDFWKRAKVYAKTVAARREGEDFFFVDGPPYTTGSIHLGQVLNKTVKDAVIRWTRMRGYNVRDQPGYDMHGLPIEVQVEKSLGITNKKEIEEFGIERFVRTCRDFSLDLLKQMTQQFQALGVWMDWESPYMTIRNGYIEGAWWTLKRAHERGLIYEALRSIQWCSRCETALADAEVEYEDVTDPSIYVRFPVAGRTDESLLIWTTTPWTLPANLAIAAHPDLTYAKVKVPREDGHAEFLWLMDSAVPTVMALAGAKAHQVVETKKGQDLVGLRYEHPLASKIPYQASVQGEWVHRVVASDVVEAEYTGLVHSAPGHGPEDFELGQRVGLPAFSPVDGRGRFTADAGDYRDLAVGDANPLIVRDLREVRALFVEDTLLHAYGHCWRCKTPILFRATVQWFMKVVDIKPKMIEEVRRVRWFPDWAGSRQLEWTEGLRDWCLSRQRYWGTPAPIWRCTKCGHWTVVGSAEELRGSEGYGEGMDLHRPAIDRVTMTCEKCRATMRRVPDTVDVWFDSGVASWASLGYPARGDEFKRWWPMDWIVEGPDQTRGWFSSQLTAGVVAFDRTPYESVLMHGWVNGPDGRQMHKSLGNYIEPSEVVSKFGADSLRLYVVAVNAPWDDITFQEDGVRTAHRTLNILWNVLRFATTYMTLDGFTPSKVDVPSVESGLRPEDRWLLSRLEGLKATVDSAMESYSLHRAYRAVEAFVLDDLSRWYVKLVRERTWLDTDDPAKIAAYHILHEALMSLAALLAPVTPHISEAIYQRLAGEKLSVHMVDWPTVRRERLDPGLEASMGIVQDLVEGVSKERQRGGRKLRWPLKLIAVKAATPEAASAIDSLRSIFLAQANSKDLAILRADEEFPGTSLVVKPDAAAIGKVYKALLPQVVKVLETRPAKEIMKAFEKGRFEVGIAGHIVSIEPAMVRFERRLPEGVAAVQTPHGELYLDLRVTEELREEGYAREVIRRIQQMRKEIDLDVDDYIVVAVRTGRDLAPTLQRQQDLIARETRSRTLTFTDKAVEEEYVVEWNDVDGHSVTIGVTPLHASEALREFTKIPALTPAKAMSLFDAGYKTLAALRQVTKQELVAVNGLEPSDVSRILDALSNERKTPVPCPVCDAPLPDDARRCPRCGEPTSDEAEWCARCGSAIPPGGEACSVCGLPIVRDAKERAPSRVPCVACQEMIPSGSATCPSCGASQSSATAAVAPAPPSRVETPSSELRGASTYLVKEPASEEAYRLFLGALRAGRKGLCITRVFPAKLRERFGLPDLPILWLSNVGKEDAVRPKDLEKLSLSVEQFLTREKGVILMDGIEYLATNNNFLTVLRLLQSIRDQVAINDAIMILSANPATFETHHLTLLEREVDHVLAPAASRHGADPE